MSRQSNVRGPTSALTEFLKEKNISIPNANRFSRRAQQQQQQQQQQPPEASSSVSQVIASELGLGDDSAAEPSQASGARPSAAVSATASPGPSVPTKRKRHAPQGASMNFEEDDDDEPWDSVTEDEADAAATTASATKKTSQSRAGPSPAAPQAEDDKWGNIKAGLADGISRKLATSGSLDHCPGCSRRFTITSYTVQTASGGLCHKCGPLYNQALAAGPGPGPRAGPSSRGKGRASDAAVLASASGDISGVNGKKQPIPRKKRTIIERPQDKKVLPTLQGMCINIISHYIEDVEALGGIGDRNIDNLSKSISKNRRLNPQTLQLFLEPETESLTLYDCSSLTSDSLKTIPVFCPRLHTINLQRCGQLDNAAFDTWSDKLQDLRRLELFGPYLVRAESWRRFFEASGGRLESLKLRETPRLDLGCIKSLVANCPDLTQLGLAQIGQLDGPCLDELQQLKSLIYLDVSDPGVSAPGIPPEGLKDDEVINLLAAIGSKLRYLNLSGNSDLTDRVLLEGILPHCHSLQELHLAFLDKISSDALKIVFDSFDARGLPRLTHVELRRCSLVEDDCLDALVQHSGPALQILSLNSCNKLTGDGTKTGVGEDGAAVRVDGDRADNPVGVTTGRSSPSPPLYQGLRSIANHCQDLKELDLAFVRSCGDGEIMSLVEGCPQLEKIKVYGCNRISDYVAGTTRCQVIGLERVPLIAKNVA